MSMDEWFSMKAGLLFAVCLGLTYLGYNSTVHIFRGPIREWQVRTFVSRTREDYSFLHLKACPLHFRRQYIIDRCSSFRYHFPVHKTQNIVVDDHRNLLYCEVAKSGSTKVKTLWQLANTNLTFVDVNEAHDYSYLEDAGLKRYTEYNLTQSYTKFLVIRHPISRLISAYKNLLYFNLNGPKYTETAFLKRFQLEASGIKRLTFSMFLEAIVDEDFQFYKDRHWAPYVDTCDPCNMHYDYIIRLETMADENDMAAVLKVLGYSNKAAAEKINHGETRTDKSGHVFNAAITSRKQQSQTKNDETKALFTNVPKDLLKKVLDRYQDDMYLFGYFFDKDTYKSTCGIQTNPTCC